MSRQELVQGYLEGQISRRVFIRRLVTGGISLAAAIAYSDLLRGVPAEAVGPPAFYVVVTDFKYSPEGADPAQGQQVEWGFHNYGSTYRHSATDSTGMHYFDSGRRKPNGGYFFPFVAAGVYPYHCKEATHAPMTGKVRVPVKAQPTSGTTSTTFTIQWASVAAPSGYTYDVQIRRPGDAHFSAWLTGFAAKSHTFQPKKKGTYQFRARLRNTGNGHHSEYSHAVTVTVA